MATPRAGAGRWRLIRGVLHGGTGHARGDHRAAGDGPRPARRDAGPAVDGQHLWPGLSGRDHHRGGARRPVRAAAGVRRRPGDLHAGLGVLRRCAQRGLAAGRPDSAGHRAAAVMPLSLTILTGAFGPQRRGAIIGIWGGLGGLAVAGGPLIGGAVTEGPDWHWIFWLNVPVPLEYSIGWVSCTVCRHGGSSGGWLAGCCQDRLPADVPDARPGRPGVPQ